MVALQFHPSKYTVDICTVIPKETSECNHNLETIFSSKRVIIEIYFCPFQED